MRESRPQRRPPVPAGRRRKLLKLALSIALPATLGVAAYLAFFAGHKPGTTHNGSTRSPSAVLEVSPSRTLDDLLQMSADQLAGLDVAEMNLLCATGLPGAEHLDVNRCLARLDQWAAHVRRETDRHAQKFYRAPAEYYDSQAYFRMLTLVTVLQQDLGVHYNPDRIRNIDFTRSEDLFIHGMVASNNGGTCVSMPVLYTAVARRLGYPVKLALAKAHVFCRWDAPNERFNIEGAGRGMDLFDDDYYKTWPHPITEAELKAGHYLSSLSPAEELACFLAARGHCLLDTGRRKEAARAYAAAHRLAPEDRAYLAWAREAAGHPHSPGSPRPPLAPPPGRGAGGEGPWDPLSPPSRAGLIPEPPRYPRDPMAEARRIDAINRANLRRIQGPPTPSQPGPPPSPHGGQPGLTQPHRPPLPGRVPK